MRPRRAPGQRAAACSRAGSARASLGRGGLHGRAGSESYPRQRYLAKWYIIACDASQVLEHVLNALAYRIIAFHASQVLEH